METVITIASYFLCYTIFIIPVVGLSVIILKYVDLNKAISDLGSWIDGLSTPLPESNPPADINPLMHMMFLDIFCDIDAEVFGIPDEMQFWDYDDGGGWTDDYGGF